MTDQKPDHGKTSAWLSVVVYRRGEAWTYEERMPLALRPDCETFIRLRHVGSAATLVDVRLFMLAPVVPGWWGAHVLLTLNGAGIGPMLPAMLYTGDPEMPVPSAVLPFTPDHGPYGLGSEPFVVTLRAS